MSSNIHPMLHTFSIIPLKQPKLSNTSASLTTKRRSNFNTNNSLFLTFLSNKNKLKLNKNNKTTITPKQSSLNSFQFNTLNQTNISKLESIDESVKVSYQHLITDINQTNIQSRLLNSKYADYVSGEEERINNEIIELKPDLHQPVFVKDDNNKKTDFAKVIEHLISLKKKITPKLIKEILKNSEGQREIEKRRMILINQKKGNDAIMKMLNYRLNVGKKYKKK